jgi:hypothetical protein
MMPQRKSESVLITPDFTSAIVNGRNSCGYVGLAIWPRSTSLRTN